MRPDTPGTGPAGLPGEPPQPGDELEQGSVPAILELIGQGILVLGPHGSIRSLNSAAGRLLGNESAGAIAWEAVEDLASQAVESGEGRERTVDLLHPTRRTLSIRANPLGDGRAAVVVDDVSDRQRLESIRRDFVANVSHELKTPVGALSLLAETLDGEEDPDVVVRLAARIGAEAERLVRIIDDLLDLSRIEAAEGTESERITAHELVRASADPLLPLAASRDIELRIDEPEAGLAVIGDRHDLTSAVSNLIDNAVKYSEPGGTVVVSAAIDGDTVSIEVSDEGVGIPAKDLERIFERFYRVDRARSRLTGGTGLGLSIVRHVAANHGGTVTVRSVEGRGSVFSLRLPSAGPATLPDEIGGEARG